MKHFLLVSIFLIVISGCQTSNSNGETNITVAAAASLSDVMKEVNELYEDEHPNTEITLNLASSGVLANQIKQGAPIDVYLSASESHFHEVEEKDLIDPDHYTNLLRNKLVLIKSKAAELNNFDHLRSNNIDRIAIGTPETVPAGAYAKESLQSLKLWDKLQDKFIFGKDVRQVLTYVETGNAEAGLVYETDYEMSNNVSLVSDAPENTYTPIIYPAGVLNGANSEAVKYFAFLQSKEALSVFEKYGFQSEVSSND